MSASPALLRRLLGLLRTQRTWLWAGLALALLAALGAVGLMATSGWFIAAMALAGASGAAINYFTPAALIRGFAILRSGGRYAERLTSHEATLRVLTDLRVWLFGRLIPLAPARLAALRSAELFARLRADIDTLEQVNLSVLVPTGVAAVITLLTLAVMLAALPWAALPLLALAALAGGVLPTWTRCRGAADAAATVTEAAQQRDLLMDALRGHADLLALGADGAHRRRIDALARLLDARRARVDRLQGLGQAAAGLAAQGAVLTLLLFGLPALNAHALAPTLLVMLVMLTLVQFEVLAPLPEALAQWQGALTAAGRVFALADMPPAIVEPAHPAAVTLPLAIRFDGVRLRYDDAAPWALDGIDLDLAPGARLAVVGPSGAGKSSLIGALLKFHPVQQGHIQFGGQPLDALCGEDVRAQIAVVAQRTHLFNRSLLDNLLLARPDADAAAIERAVHRARLDAFVARLPRGYDTMLGEGGALVSGGEARRIVIARALLKDAPILLLDEPTEGLDAITAREICTTLAEVARGRSLLLITHRLTGLEHLVDEVAVLESGRVARRMPVSACRTMLAPDDLVQ